MRMLLSLRQFRLNFSQPRADGQNSTQLSSPPASFCCCCCWSTDTTTWYRCSYLQPYIKMQALQGTTRVVFMWFFVSHCFITFCIDGQALFPTKWYPTALTDLLAWEVSTFNDPLMGSTTNLLWFRSLVACEFLFQLPFFFTAIHFMSQRKGTTYPDWFRCACIAYGAHTATTMVPIIAALATNPKAGLQSKIVISEMYLPYAIFPLWLMWIAVTDVPKKKD